MLWPVSDDADGFTGRRLVATRWRTDLKGRQAAAAGRRYGRPGVNVRLPRRHQPSSLLMEIDNICGVAMMTRTRQKSEVAQQET
jgi:hypothetical protein